MAIVINKKQLLERANYHYNTRLCVYYNPAHRKAFCLETVMDHSPEWLQNKIQAANEYDNWDFYFRN